MSPPLTLQIAPYFFLFMAFGSFFCLHFIKKQLSVAEKRTPQLVLSAWFLFSLSILILVLTVPVLFTHFDSTLTIDTAVVPYRELVESTHPALLQHLRLVSIEQPPLDLSLYMDVYHSSGVYLGMTRSIYILKHYMSYDIWWHELGHHIWYYLMTAEERAAFTALHTADVDLYATGALTGFPSEYAMKNVEEDFADSFELYMDEDAYLHSQWVMVHGTARVAIIEKVLVRLTGCASPSPLCAMAPSEG